MNKHKQRGAAMVETVLIVAGMVILLVAIPKLAKYQDVRQATVDASRYATWQMTVSEAPDREKIIERMFSKPDSPIRSQNTELSENTFWRSARRPLIRDHALTPVGPSQALANLNNVGESLVDLRSVALSTTEQSASTGAVASTITSTVQTVSNWLGDSDAIAPNRGIVKSAISVAINANSTDGQGQVECGVGAAECMSISSSILVDGWEAKDSDAIETGAQVMVPTKLLKPIGEALSLVSVVPLLKEFEHIDDSFGCVNTTTLPTKELSGELADSGGDAHEC